MDFGLLRAARISHRASRFDLAELSLRSLLGHASAGCSCRARSIRRRHGRTMSSQPAGAQALESEAALRTVVAILVKPASTRDAALLHRLDQYRQKYDQACARWAPHITLVPPFLLESKGDASSISLLESVVVAASEAASKVQPFQVKLTHSGIFALKGYDNVHIRPESGARSAERTGAGGTQALRDLHRAIVPLFATVRGPMSKRKRKQDEHYQPHVSIGQARGDAERQEVLGFFEDLQQGGIVCDVDRFQVLAKGEYAKGPYALVSEVLLSGVPRDKPYALDSKSVSPN